MNLDKAIKMGIECLKLRKRNFVFTANTAKQFRKPEDWTPHQKHSVKMVGLIDDAIEALEDLLESLE